MPGELVSQLDGQRTNRAAEHGVVRDDVGSVACLEDGDAHHRRLLWRHPPADHLLHGRHEQRACGHRVAAGFRLTGMAAASGNRDREARVGAQDRAVVAGGAAEGNGRPVVIAEDALHSVESALVDHLPGAEPTLLGRLKEQRHGPVQRSLVLFEPRCGGQEAGGVPVVPAGVHPTGLDRCVRQRVWPRRWEAHRYRREALDALPSHQRQACLPCRFRRTHATGFRADPAPASRRRLSTSRATPPRDGDGVHGASARRGRRCGRSWLYRVGSSSFSLGRRDASGVLPERRA